MGQLWISRETCTSLVAPAHIAVPSSGLTDRNNQDDAVLPNLSVYKRGAIRAQHGYLQRWVEKTKQNKKNLSKDYDSADRKEKQRGAAAEEGRKPTKNNSEEV